MKVDFYLPEYRATKIVTWKSHVDESTYGIYYMILGRNILTALRLDHKFSDNVILGKEGPYGACSELMVDVSNYKFNIITAKTVKP